MFGGWRRTVVWEMLAVPAGHDVTLRTDILSPDSGPKVAVRGVKSPRHAEIGSREIANRRTGQPGSAVDSRTMSSIGWEITSSTVTSGAWVASTSTPRRPNASKGILTVVNGGSR